jgi:hypothetical protein
LAAHQLADWVDFELNGFPVGTTLPDYRRLGILYFGTFSNVAWQLPRQAVPLQVIPEEHRAAFRSVEFRDGIAKAVSFARSDHNVKIHKPELIFALQGAPK